jgi:hypothetical protein
MKQVLEVEKMNIGRCLFLFNKWGSGFLRGNDKGIISKNKSTVISNKGFRAKSLKFVSNSNR